MLNRSSQPLSPTSDTRPPTPGAVPIPIATLRSALRLTVRRGWDHLGLLMAVSATWLALLALTLSVGKLLPLALPPSLRLGILLLLGTLLLSAPLAGAHHIAHLIASHDEVSYLEFWQGVRRLAGPATRLGLIHLLALSIFAANFWFYLQLNGFMGRAAVFLCLYVFLAWGMMMVLHYPLLAAQEAGIFDEPDHRARRGALAVLRRAFFLALGRPFYTLGLLLVAALTALVFTLTGVLLALLWAGGIALLTTHATRLLLIQYGVLPPPPTEEPIPDEKFRLGGERRP